MLIFFLPVVEFFIGFLRFKETLLRKFLELFLLLGYFDFKFFPSFPLLLIGLFIFEYLTLTLIYDLQEKVFHKTHRLLVFFGFLNLYKLIVTRAYAL